MAVADNAPNCWQKMEWIGEARIVLRSFAEYVDVEGNEPYIPPLEEKIRAAELVLRKQMGLPEEDYYDDEEYEEEDDNLSEGEIVAEQGEVDDEPEEEYGEDEYEEQDEEES